MPFGINRHSNRSKQALNDTAAQGTGTPSSGSASELTETSPVFADEARTTPQAFNQQRAEGQPFAPSHIGPDSDKQQNSGDPPARSQSTRYASAYQPQGYQGGHGGKSQLLGVLIPLGAMSNSSWDILLVISNSCWNVVLSRTPEGSMLTSVSWE
jgi:hypothetical protein